MSNTPKEIISLPSHGWYYSSDNPLSTGSIELYYMTAKSENILTSQTYIRQGIVIDKLLESLIVDNSVKYDNLMLGDKNAILVASRVLAYGKEYPVKIQCSVCGVMGDCVVDLTKIQEKIVPEPDPKGINEFTFKLPYSGVMLTYQFLTQGLERSINQEIEKMSKASGDKTPLDYTTRLKYIIVAVNGDRSQEIIRKFVDNEFLARDSRAFREYYIKMTPDVDLTFDWICATCGETGKREVAITSNFFWPESRI